MQTLRIPGVRGVGTQAAPLARRRCVAVRARAGSPPPVAFNIHGRHVTVDEPMEQMVKDKLQPALDLLKGAQFLEGEGGVHDCDVRLMNTEVQIHLRPNIRNKALHDTFLRQGEIKVIEMGPSMDECLNKAVVTLANKLKKIAKKPDTLKVDYRKMSP